MAAAGWHEDPTRPDWLRWWDGKAWGDAYWPSRLAPADYLPTAARFDISVSGEPRLDIVGENWRESEILAAIGREGTPRDAEFEGYGVAELVPEPDNPHDQNAISVRIAGYIVGYLAAEDAVEYAPVVQRLIAGGVVPTVRTRVWGVTRFVRSRSREELKSAIRVALARGSGTLPDNEPPSNPYYLIPRGRTVQVTGDESHFDVLRPYVRTSVVTSIVVTLEPIDGKTPSSPPILEVRLDGRRIGQLTPGMSTSILPLVEEARAYGRAAAAWATLRGSRLAAEVTLTIARPEDVPDLWPSESDVLPRLRAEGTVPPAYRPQVVLGPPPQPAGLSRTWWVIAIITALVLLAIPYIGWLFSAAVIAGMTVWHFLRRRRPPKEAYAIPV